jgi:hypothetical protein
MDVVLIQPDDARFIDKLADRILEKLKPALDSPKKDLPIKETVYLTRKQASEILKVSAPTLDGYVQDNLIERLGGKGKRGRFRYEDVINLYENLDQYYHRQRKNPHLIHHDNKDVRNR